jgi:hypothetical protein
MLAVSLFSVPLPIFICSFAQAFWGVNKEHMLMISVVVIVVIKMFIVIPLKNTLHHAWRNSFDDTPPHHRKDRQV